MYGVVQFAASEGGTVAVVVNKWITPKKSETYWPPVKEAKAFDKLLQRCSSPNEQWKLYEIDRVFNQTDVDLKEHGSQRICHAHINVSLMVARVLDHSVPYKMVELDGADPRVMFVNGRRQLRLVIS